MIGLVKFGQLKFVKEKKKEKKKGGILVMSEDSSTWMERKSTFYKCKKIYQTKYN